MGTVRKSQVMDQLQQAPAQPTVNVGSPNDQVEWNDQDIADAFVNKGASHGVTISPDTAMELANQVRSKVKKNDILELNSVINEIIGELFPKNTESSATKAALDIITVVSNRIEKYKKIFAQEGSGPIGPEEEHELRAGVLDDLIIPFQEGIDGRTADATRKLMVEILPLEQEKNSLKQSLTIISRRIDELKNDLKQNPSDAAKKKELRDKSKEFDTGGSRYIDLRRKTVVIRSKLTLLDRISNYVKKGFLVMDQYHGVDGMSRYFEEVLSPGIANIKDIIIKVRRGIVLPEVEAKDRHTIEWIMRHHHTKSYQTGEIGPSVDNITLDEFKKSPVYKELAARGITDQTISHSLDQLDSKPMTWRKGQAIYMLLDPPAEKTVNKDIPTLMQETPADIKNEEGKVVNPAWSPEISTNQPFNIEKGKFEEQKEKMEKNTNPRGMSKERKISEAANENAHWSVLFNLSRNQKVDASGKTRAEKYIESLPESMRDNEEVLKNAAKMEEEDHLNDKEIIYSALWNPNTPDWVLMKAALTGYAETTRRIAKAILERRRGWQPKLDDAGHPIKDTETNDFVWERVPGFDVVASFSLKQIFAQMPTVNTDPAAQQAVGTKNSIQQQINGIDQQLQTHQQQSQQLQVQKVNLQKQMDSVKVPTPPAQPAAGTTTQPAPGAAPVENSGMPPAQPMAADGISFRKFADMYGMTELKPEDYGKPDMDLSLDTDEFQEPTEPEEGDFVYDDASSGLSIQGEKFLGKFIEWEEVETAIREYARAHQWFPSVWQISDHGNAHLVTDFDYGDTTKPVESTKPFYQRMRDKM